MPTEDPASLGMRNDGASWGGTEKCSEETKPLTTTADEKISDELDGVNPENAPPLKDKSMELSASVADDLDVSGEPSLLMWVSHLLFGLAHIPKKVLRQS
eukprot:Gregarina_sp_Poly_1__6113@NODE_322_length_9532_cov_315_419546_g274_i0_p13_GENE_NODE_322_length_9532_cov_315_419546_g274_i0NODE_322_length_9532_cov_315_419546_g274_i0_p13_ORF_typecomplete_len100_score15_11_NODE_322_length_9532_cov_315_419546_g274_i036183917